MKRRQGRIYAGPLVAIVPVPMLITKRCVAELAHLPRLSSRAGRRSRRQAGSPESIQFSLPDGAEVDEGIGFVLKR